MRLSSQYEAVPPSVRAQNNSLRPHGAEDADVAQTSFAPKKENPAGWDGRGFRNIGRPGIGGAGGRPSPLVARHPDQVQSSKHRYSTASPDG